MALSADCSGEKAIGGTGVIPHLVIGCVFPLYNKSGSEVFIILLFPPGFPALRSFGSFPSMIIAIHVLWKHNG